ncbi:MAG: hypothetical protein K2X93_24370 [Candidatus Obscuribacterales bacterium]|nr:hypothetical protein [Candidatus Obscuribacterales bacterium]
MYATKQSRKSLPIKYQCEDCEETFHARDGAKHCPFCYSMEKSNLIILHMEEDAERVEWLELVDFSAGD